MWQFDLYSELVRTPSGILKAAAPQNGIILYGRVNNHLPEIPKALARYADEIANKHFALYVFDIFASQWGLAPVQTAAASDGRVLLLLPDTQPEYEISVFNTKLTYLRQTQIGPSREANLVLGCFWNRLDNSYSLEPAKLVTADMMNIEPADIEIFKTNLIAPDTFKSAQVPFPKRLGCDCPLLTGDPNPLPAFYDTTPMGTFVQIKSLRQFMMCLQDRHLAETRPIWSISAELSKYLGCARTELSTDIAKSITSRELNPITKQLFGELAIAEARFNKIRQEYLANTRDSFQSNLEDYLDVIKSYLLTLGDKLGRARVKALLLSIVHNTDSEIRGAEDEIDTILDDSDLSLEQVLDTLLDSQNNANELFEYLKDNNLLGNLQARVLLGFLWSTLYLKSNFSDIINNTQTEAQLAYYVLQNPYALVFISPNISLSDLDILACFVGKANDPQRVLPLRSIAYMHAMLNNHDSKAVIFEQGKLIIDPSYKLTKAQLNNLTQYGSILTQNQLDAARYLNPDAECQLIRSTNIIQTYSDSALVKLDVNPVWVLQQYLDSGLGIQMNYNNRLYLLDYLQAKQFCYILERLALNNTKASTSIDYSPYISEFEAQVGFKLEPEQKRAVELLDFNSSCLTGPAGSGKTTVLRLLIHCLKRAQGITDEQIVLVAPTGRAAKRMSELTGYPARTIHSQFNLANESVPYNYSTQPAKDFKPAIIIFDEASMIAQPLLYLALHKIPEGTQVIFTGDIEQLPPINTGKPFADLLTTLPYIRLLVSKRAKEGSSITKNCNTLLSNSLESLESSQDVQFISALDNSAFPEFIASICRYYLDPVNTPKPFANTLSCNCEISPDDIQVVTPLSKPTYHWGTVNLNNALREVFNPKFRGQKKVIFRDGSLADIELRVGDRVINSTNNNAMPRYIFGEDEDTLIRQGSGILNGDMGIIKAIRPSCEYNFLCLNEAGDLVPDIKALKLANTTRKGTKLFVMVEYTDLDDSKYLVAYTCYTEAATNSIVTPSADLRSLYLGYAITVHKMQGSQAKLVIAPLFKCKARGFISKNLVYTAWSRASKALYVVGDVATYKSSALGTASQINNLATRLSPCDIT